jgi:phosphoribosyl-dephospho-CoA transferase
MVQLDIQLNLSGAIKESTVIQQAFDPIKKLRSNVKQQS